MAWLNDAHRSLLLIDKLMHPEGGFLLELRSNILNLYRLPTLIRFLLLLLRFLNQETSDAFIQLEKHILSLSALDVSLRLTGLTFLLDLGSLLLLSDRLFLSLIYELLPTLLRFKLLVFEFTNKAESSTIADLYFSHDITI